MLNYSKDFLEQVTKDHPYFSVAQFCLLKKTAPAAESFAQQAARSAIFFNNPHWLNFQLHQATTGNEDTSTIPLPDLTADETISINEEVNKADVIESPDELEQKKIILNNKEEILSYAATENKVEVQNNEEELSEDEDSMEEEIEPMKLELKMPPENGNHNNLLFEPLHLVDYFASQGIKLNEEVLPGDKLGKQLKSFTDWLKTMKKIHTNEQEQLIGYGASNAEHTDITIQNLAEISNTEDEILTEAMADVLAKQGKHLKAAELYQKLSLLNTSKSAYFAAKSENLKG